MSFSIKSIIQKSVVRNSIWLFVLQGFNTILPLLTVPYVTRVLSPEGYGDFSIALNWAGYMQLIVEYGFALNAPRKLAISTSLDEEAALYSRVIWARGLLCILEIIVVVFGYRLLPLSDVVKKCIVILCISVIGTVVQHTWFFQGKEDMRFITISNVVSRAVSTVLIFVFVKKQTDVFTYCFLYSSHFVVVGFIGLIIAKRRYHVKIKRCSCKDIFFELKDSFNLFLSASMVRVISAIGVTYLGFVVSSTSVGIYNALNKFPYLITLAWAPISQSLYPYMSKSFDVSWKNGVKTLKKLMLPIMLGFSLMGGFIIIARYPLTKLVFGDQYLLDVDLVIPLIIWVIVGILNNFLGIQVLCASGKSKEYRSSIIVCLVMTVSLTFLLGSKYLSFGVAYASLISEVGLSFVLAMRIRHINRNNECK